VEQRFFPKNETAKRSSWLSCGRIVFTDFSSDVFSVSGGLLFRTDCKGDRKRKYLKLKHGTYKDPTRSGQTCVVALHLPRKIANEPLKQDEVFQLCAHIYDSMFMNV